MYIHESIIIVSEALKIKVSAKQIAAIIKIRTLLIKQRHKHKNPHHGQGVSRNSQTFFSINKLELQIVPPNTHRTNEVEKAIETSKDHFKEGLSTLHPQFPLHFFPISYQLQQLP